MKKILLVLLFINFLFANDQPLKIVVNKSMLPYSYLDVTNQPSGLFVDYWQLWAKKMNKPVEFLPLNWTDGLKAIKEGKADIHSGLFNSQDRQEYINFIKPLFNAKSHIYINSNDKNSIRRIDDLYDKTIGLISGSFFESYFKKNHPKIKIKKYTVQKNMIADVHNKKIDAFIGDSLVTWIESIRHFNFIKTVELPTFELNNWFYAGIAKKNKMLEQIVINGMNMISKKELIDLEEKWIVKEELRYFTQKESSNLFTQEEKVWLEQNPAIVLSVTKAWNRFSFMDDKGNLKGFHLDLIAQLNKNLNINIKTKVYDNWTQAYNAAKNSEVDGILGLSWSKQREKFFHYSPSYHYSPYHIVSRANSDIKSVKDFNTKTAVTLKNSITNKIIKDKAPNAKIIYAKNANDILNTIKEKKADAALLESAKDLNLQEYDLKIIASVFTKEGELSIGTPKNKKIIADILKKGIDSLTQKQINRLKNRWFEQESIFTLKELLYIKSSPILTVGVDTWAPVYFLNNNNELDGISGDFFKQISKISGLKFKVKKGNWSQNLKRLKDKEIDILPAVFYTKERTSYGLFTDSYINTRTSLFVKENNKKIKSFKDLSGLKLGVMKDDARIKEIKKQFKNIQLIETENIKASVYKLINNEVDAIAALDIVVQHVLNKELITGVKTILQNEIKANSTHIFSKKDDPLLQSILQKSLFSISNDKRNQIIDKWLRPKIKKSVNIAFGVGREPYTLNKTYLKGIEYDLIKKILNKNGISINKTKNFPLNDLEYILKDDDTIDLVVTIKEKKDGFYYSDNFINFENVAISRIEDNIYIDSISDLRDKNIIAFEGAYKYLGDEYNKLFNPINEPNTYLEVGLQEYQVRDFLEKRVDVIILDKNIFKWYLKKLSNDSINKYKLDFIFSGKNSYQVSFRDENLRNLFNKNLQIIKQSGEYEDIVFNYVQSDIEAKVKISSLVSSIVARYIFSNEKEELNHIIKAFANLPYLNKIEVYNNEQNLLASSSTLNLKKYTTQDSFYFISNIPQKVGNIRVYFDEEELINHSNNSKLIPDIEDFDKLKSYAHIKEIYKRFDYLTKKIEFSKKEKNFIKSNPVISFSEINWRPLSIIEDEKFSGIFADYMKIIEDKTGLEFKYIKADTWLEVIEKFKNKELDLIPSISGTKKEREIGLVSNEYINFNFAIVTNKEGSFTNGIRDLKGKTIALPKGYTSYNLIKNNYPNIKIIETKSIQEALTLVSQKKAYAFVGHSAVSVYNIKDNFPELKIVGVSQERFLHHFLIQNTHPELLSIINKVISTMPHKQQQDIKDKWIKTEISTAIDYSIIYKIIAVFTLILLIVLIFTKKLSKAKKQIETANKKLNESIDTLIKTQAQLVESKKLASLGGLVAGVAHEINTPVGIGLTGITHFLDITKKIKSEYENENMSQEDFENYLNTSEKLANTINLNLNKTADLVKSFKQVAVEHTTEEKKEFNLKECIMKTLTEIEGIIKKSNLTVKVEGNDSLTINSYPGAFSQIITNLVINSIRHGYKNMEKGNVQITITKEDNKIIKFVYTDDGQGIKKENLGKIFDPFFTTNREKGGTGLGLNVIHNIVTADLNGTIVCNSDFNKGVEFIIKFRI